LTDLPAEKITELTNPQKTHPKQAKVLLGKTIVAQFYDAQTAEAAADNFEKVFAQKQLPDEIPEIKVPPEPVSLKQLLVCCGLVATGGEAKRICSQSGVSIDGEKKSDPNEQITPKNGMTIQVGKRKFAKIKIKN
jgi:tyrosyl-tRNA synthetase